MRRPVRCDFPSLALNRDAASRGLGPKCMVERR